MSIAADSPRSWLFDIGNTRLKWVRADSFATDAVQARAHADTDDPDALDIAFADVRAGDRAWIASVASQATTAAIEAALNRRGANCVHAATRGDCAGVRIAYAHPSRLGVDRFLALLGARARMPGAALIVNVGTALTIDLLDADGGHHGGLIAPSPTLMREALAHRAPRLPVEGGRVLDFADDTDDALASGTILSARALIVRSLRAAQQRLGARPALLVAGGGADAVCTGWRMQLTRTPYLVLHGLQVYAHAVHE